MKTIGAVVSVLGVFWLFIALLMPRTIKNEHSLDSPSYMTREIINFDMIDRRRDHVTLASVLIVVGVNLYSAGRAGKSATEDGRLPDRDLASDPHVREEVLELGIERRDRHYSVSGYDYDTYEEALAHARSNPSK